MSRYARMNPEKGNQVEPPPSALPLKEDAFRWPRGLCEKHPDDDGHGAGCPFPRACDCHKALQEIAEICDHDQPCYCSTRMAQTAKDALAKRADEPNV